MSQRRPRKTPLGATVAATIAVALVALVVAAVGSSRPTAVSANPRAAQHGFPRTLSVNKCVDGVARRDMIVSYAYCDPRVIRRVNPKGIFLLQPGLFPDGSNGYGGMSVTYGTGLWFWREGYAWKNGGCDTLPGGVNLGCMRQFSFDYDQLNNADGSMAGISNGTSGHRGWNLADPVGKGTRELVAKFIAYSAKLSGVYARGWDGIFSDNWIYGVVGESWAYGPNLDTDRDGKVDDYRVLRKRWDDGLNDVGNRIRSYLPGKIVAGNGSWYPMKYGYHGTDPQGWLKASNATMVEGIQQFYNSSADLLRIAARWSSFRDPSGQPRYVMFLQDALTGSGEKLTIPADADPNKAEYMLDASVMRSMRWGLTLALMSGAYYEIHVNGNHSTLWWYDEYDGGKGIRRRGYLGQAVKPAVALGGGVWRREFERGVAFNNSTAKSVVVTLKKPLRHLLGTQDRRVNNGRIVSRLTIPAHDGVILMNVKPTKK